MSDTTELVKLPPKETALNIYSTPGGLDAFIEQVKSKLSGIVHDVSTKKGRDEIASDAYKVARSKAAIENLGKEISAELKEMPKKIDAERKRAFEELEKFQQEIRRPLTEWEAAEKSRIEQHKQAIEKMRAHDTEGMSSSLIGAMIQQLDTFDVTPAFQEFEQEAHRAKADGLAMLRTALDKQEKYEAEQAELERLRKESAEREQRDREALIAQEAAEAERAASARREAEAKAAVERAEREKQEAIVRQQQAEQRAEAERLAAAERAKQAAEAAKQAEIQRQKDEQAQIEAEAKRREANTKHRKAINNEALDALVAGGLSADCAKQAITLIAKGNIPHIAITY